MSKSRTDSPAKPPLPAEAPFSEAPAWITVGAGWRPLFGRFHSLGFSIEWHDFTSGTELDWSHSFHPGSLELCLNLDGHAALSDARQVAALPPRASIFYFQGEPPLVATRRAGERHRFVTFEFSPQFLKQHLAESTPHLHPLVEGFLMGTAQGSFAAIPQAFSRAALELADSVQHSPAFKPAEELWFRGKALEAVAQMLFSQSEGETSGTRQQRAAFERAARTRQIMRERLANPPSLEELGRLIGCSPFYLSRQFSEAEGITIQQYLRQARLEKAADLLRAGKHNVTEAALEVGYNSLSHFTVAFRDMFGCCPGLYPLRAKGMTGFRTP